MKNESLQSLAKMAKQRLAGGYWQNNFAEVKEGKKPLSAYFNNDALARYSARSKDYERKLMIVRNILKSDNALTNPLNLLIDEEYFNTLSDDRKQGYILQLSREYRQMKEVVVGEIRAQA